MTVPVFGGRLGRKPYFATTRLLKTLALSVSPVSITPTVSAKPKIGLSKNKIICGPLALVALDHVDALHFGDTK